MAKSKRGKIKLDNCIHTLVQLSLVTAKRKKQCVKKTFGNLENKCSQGSSKNWCSNWEKHTPTQNLKENPPPPPVTILQEQASSIRVLNKLEAKHLLNCSSNDHIKNTFITKHYKTTSLFKNVKKFIKIHQRLLQQICLIRKSISN